MPEAATPPERMMTSDEVAKVMRVAPHTVRRMRAAGKFPHAVRPGKSWLIPESDLIALLKKTYQED